MFNTNQNIITRFAPSPSGHLHLGHAYSALMTAKISKNAGKNDSQLLLRIEDIDISRCRKEFEDSIIEDLIWLGLQWQKPILRQSDRFDIYDSFLNKLTNLGLTYPCFCSRKDIANNIDRILNAPHGPDGFIYPATCKNLTDIEIDKLKSTGKPYAIRMHMDRAVAITGGLDFFDEILGRIKIDAVSCGDIILARKDMGSSYHLSVVIDDGLQGVNLITRGVDLLHATHVQRVLQCLFGFVEPIYHHHKLLSDENGRRYAKRDHALTLKSLRDKGKSPDDIKNMIGL